MVKASPATQSRFALAPGTMTGPASSLRARAVAAGATWCCTLSGTCGPPLWFVADQRAALVQGGPS